MSKIQELISAVLILGGALAFGVALLLCGCAHNVDVHGVGMASPYFAFGYGSFSVVKDNVDINSTTKTLPTGAESTRSMTIGKQTNGYDVELAEANKSKQ